MRSLVQFKKFWRMEKQGAITPIVRHTLMLIRILLFYILLFCAAPVWASDSVVIADFSEGADANGVPHGWELKEKSGKADISVTKDGDISAVHLLCKNASFSLEKKVDVDIREYPVLTWKWKVTQLPEGGDFRTSQTDDQAAQLFLAFSKTKVLVYLWDTTAPQGLMHKVPSPPLMSIKAVVVRSGTNDTGKWITETRNVYEDYKKLFGNEPPRLGGVRLQINSQHTKSSAESYFADVVCNKK
jgi:hypothetical protein